MKNQLNNKYLTISLYAFGAIASSILFLLFLVKFSYIRSGFFYILKLLSPVIYGLVISYLLNPIMKFFERSVFRFKRAKKDRCKLRRTLSLVFSYLVGAMIITIFFVTIIPQLTQSIETLINNFTSYSANLENYGNMILNKFGDVSKYFGDSFQSFGDIVDNIVQIVKDSLPIIVEAMKNGAIEIKNFFLGLIISIYFLAGKEKLLSQIKKLMYAFLPKKWVVSTLGITKYTHETISDFIVGKLLDSAIVGVLCFISMSIFNLKFALLISFIVGITNVIPYFGPFIGAIPSIIILLMVKPMDALWFGILILVLQQIDGNIIGPKILGESIGLSAFWVIFAIIVMSGFFGAWGMFLGVPIFAVIYELVKKFTNDRLKKKTLPTSTNEYLKYNGEGYKFN